MVFRRMKGMFLAAMLLPVLAVPARAGSQTGSILVAPDGGLTDVLGRRVTLYRVGEETKEGYRIGDDFGGGMVLWEDALSPHLARLFAGFEGDAGSFRVLDGDGIAEFTDLEAGLYLLTEQGSDSVILPCLVTLPMQGQWDLQVYPGVRQLVLENPETGQHPAPILGGIGMVFSGIGLAVCAGRGRKDRDG